MTLGGDIAARGRASSLEARIAEAARWIGGLSPWRQRGLALLAGALSMAAMAPLFFSPVLLLTLPVLFELVASAEARGRGRSQLRSLLPAFAAGWWFGFGYHLIGLYWIAPAFLVEADKFAWLLPFAVTLLPAAMAIYHGIAAALTAAALRAGVNGVFALAISLSVTEWLRGHLFTGFPWNVLGYALTFPLALLQGVSVLGIYGLTLLTVLVFTAPVAILKEGGGAMKAALALMAPLALLFAFGFARLALVPVSDVEGVMFRIVQPSIPQSEKWRPERQAEFFLSHLELSGEAPDGTQDHLAHITHVVWPEASMPFQPLRAPAALRRIAELLPDGVRLIAGALRTEPDDKDRLRPFRAYNSVMVFGKDGALEGLVDKAHLTPFGEYLPLQATLESLGIEQLSRFRGGFSSGREPRPLLSVAGLPPVGPLICYESNFPGEAVEGASRPGLLLNITNDGWFGRTSGPYEHFHQSRVRAVEEGLPMIRAANNGISAIIDPLGRVRASLGLDRRGTIDGRLPAALSPPLIARLGDGVFLLGLVLAAGVAVMWRRRR